MSSEKAEKVVKPPSTPVRRKLRISAGTFETQREGLRQKPHDKAADQIDAKRAPGKIGTEGAHHLQVEEIARRRADRTADSDCKNTVHLAFSSLSRCQ